MQDLQAAIDARIVDLANDILQFPVASGQEWARLEMLVAVGMGEFVDSAMQTAAANHVREIQAAVGNLVRKEQLPQKFIDEYNSQMRVYQTYAQKFDPSKYK